MTRRQHKKDQRKSIYSEQKQQRKQHSDQKNSNNLEIEMGTKNLLDILREKQTKRYGHGYERETLIEKTNLS